MSDSTFGARPDGVNLVNFNAAAGDGSSGTPFDAKVVMFGQYNASLPTLTDGQQGIPQLDSSSRLLITATFPAGAATAANQTTEIAGLAAIVSALGSVPVVTNGDGSPTGGTAGSKSLLAGGIYHTSAPTLTNGQQCGLQTDVNGKLLISGSFSATQTDPAATTGNITAADSATTTATNSVGQSITTGAPTANSSLACTLSANSGATLQISGTASVVVVFERSADGGTTWVPFPMEEVGIGASVITLTISDDKAYILRGNVGEMTTVRVRCTTHTSGTLAANWQPGFGVGQVVANQGVPNALANYWPVAVTDGSHTMPTGDASGRAIYVQAASLPLPTGAATAAKQPALGTAGSASSDVITVQGIASMTALKVDGSGVTQPISAASLPLPTGASTAAKQPALGTAGSASSDVITVQGIASMTALVVSAASLPLPTGAATAAKQPALGTAGSAASDVITVQGIASMTALKVDGSGVTQPVSAASLPLPTGASTAAKQPALGTAGSASSDVITVQGIASMTALAVSAASLPLPTGAATAANQTNASQKTQIVDGSGNVIAATSNALNVHADQSGSWNIGTLTAIINPLPSGGYTIGCVTPVVGTTGAGGATPYLLAASAASTNATSVKATAGTLYGIQAFNLAAYPVFIKFYNKASAPTVGTDTPVKVIMLPANATAANGIGLVHSWTTGIAFGTGLAIAITKGQGNSDTTAVSAGDCSVNLDYA